MPSRFFRPDFQPVFAITRYQSNAHTSIQSTHGAKSEKDLPTRIEQEGLQSGLRIEMGAPADINRPIDGQGDDVSLLSVRTEDILQNDEAKSLFSYIVCAIETLRQHGISVQRKVTCLCNEFYLTYCFPESEREYFENLHRHWNDLFYINERVGSWTEKELAPLEEKLRADITGENDVAYSGKDDEV